jgi:hypothetical protein
MRSLKAPASAFAVILIATLLISFFVAWIVSIAWNVVVSPVFGITEITVIQAWLALALIEIVAKIIANPFKKSS